MEKLSLTILAAGWGARYGGLKQVAGFGPNGECLIHYSIYDAYQAGIKDVWIVIREEITHEIKNALSQLRLPDLKLNFVYQRTDDLPAGSSKLERHKPWGTAHALYSLRNKLNNSFIMINADDYYSPQSFQILAKALGQNKSANQYQMISYKLKQCLSTNGGVSRGICETKEGKLINIKETHQLKLSRDNIIRDKDNNIYSGDEEVSMNCWGFTQMIFNDLETEFIKFLNSNKDLKIAEFILPKVVMNQILKGKIQVDTHLSNETPFGATYIADKELIKNTLYSLHQSGLYPKTLLKIA